MSSSLATEIVHRWEWRAFGSHFERAQDVFATMEAVGEPQETDEVYLLTDDESNLKIRSDLLDLKTLLEFEDGLQLWAPILKVGFPIDPAVVTAIFEERGHTVPQLRRSSYTQSQFLDEVVAPMTDVDLVDVHKERVRYAPDGCMAELTRLTANGVETRTVAVESEDSGAILAVVEKLGLGGYENTSYTRGLKCLLGLEPVRYAVIDVGTNSVKFHVGEQHPDGTWSRVIDRADVTRLGEGLDESGDVQPGPMERTADAIAGMIDEARGAGVLALAAVGTAGMRIAGNRDSVVARFAERAGAEVEVVSGEEESRLAYLAAKAGVGLADSSVVVFDTGGGSTQFTLGQGSEVEDRFSVNVGAVSYTERFGLAGAVDTDVIGNVLEAVSRDLSRIEGREPPDALVAMGGAVTNLAAISHSMAEYDPDVVQGTVLDVSEIDRQIDLFRSLDSTARKAIVGIQPNRAEVILAGACIVRTIMDLLGCSALTVSDRGLRHGLLAERFGLFGAPAAREEAPIDQSR